MAMETPHGAMVKAPMDRGITASATNPKQLDRFRDRFSPAGARVTVAMPSCRPLPYAPIAIASDAWWHWIRWSWNFASGREWHRNSKRNGRA